MTAIYEEHHLTFIPQFIENFKPPSSVLPLGKSDALSPSNVPWFYYGGSYAGARAAHMRTQYPHLVWGAIASSGQSRKGRSVSNLTSADFPSLHLDTFPELDLWDI